VGKAKSIDPGTTKSSGQDADDRLDGICFPLAPGFGGLEERVEALEYPVGDTVFRPVDDASPMPSDGPSHLDDLWNPAVGGTLAITKTGWRRWFGVSFLRSVAKQKRTPSH